MTDDPDDRADYVDRLLAARVPELTSSDLPAAGVSVEALETLLDVIDSMEVKLLELEAMMVGRRNAA